MRWRCYFRTSFEWFHVTIVKLRSIIFVLLCLFTFGVLLRCFLHFSCLLAASFPQHTVQCIFLHSTFMLTTHTGSLGVPSFPPPCSANSGSRYWFDVFIVSLMLLLFFDHLGLRFPFSYYFAFLLAPSRWTASEQTPSLYTITYEKHFGPTAQRFFLLLIIVVFLAIIHSHLLHS